MAFHEWNYFSQLQTDSPANLMKNLRENFRTAASKKENLLLYQFQLKPNNQRQFSAKDQVVWNLMMVAQMRISGFGSFDVMHRKSQFNFCSFLFEGAFFGQLL